MTSRVFPPLIEVFLLVEQPRQRLSHWTRALAPLDGPGAPPMATVDAYYDPSTNQALFGLRYDEAALGPDRLKLLVEVTVLAEIGMIQPADLSEGDRRRFVTERLAKCTVHVGDQRKIVSALVELVRRVRSQKPSTSPITPITTEMTRPRAAMVVAREGSETDPTAAHGSGAITEPRPIPMLARGTRESESSLPPPLARASRDLAYGSARQARLQAAMPDPVDVDVIVAPEGEPDPMLRSGPTVALDLDDAASEPVTTPARQLPGTTPPPGTAVMPRPSPNVVTRTGVHRANTVTMSTGETQRMIDAVKAPGDTTDWPAQTGELPPERTRAASQGQDPRGGRQRTTLPGHEPARERPRSPSQAGDSRIIERTRSPSQAGDPRRRSPSQIDDRGLPPGGSAAEGRRGLIDDARTTERQRTPSQAGDSRPTEPVRGASQAGDRRATSRSTPPPPPDTAYSDSFVPGAIEAGVIYARYLRDGRWLPVRIGALSLRRATLMSGALPRVDDRVDIGLSYLLHRAVVRGTVTKVSTRQEAATTGAATFSVSFELDDSSRRQLTELLTAARAANVTIKPPPPRSTRRYPVEWPIFLGTGRGAVRAEALDVSTDGMFVKPLHALSLDAQLSFSAVLDDGLAPVSGRSRVVRHVSDSEAQAAGLLAGYGLCILEMAEPDRARWCAFLARIEKRAAKRVLIGASPARLAELQGGLVAAGYAVTGGTDAGAIAQLASADARPVDAALVDAAWIADGQSASWVESLFSARNVPCVTIHGDARRARIAIDRLLSVV